MQLIISISLQFASPHFIFVARNASIGQLLRQILEPNGGWGFIGLVSLLEQADRLV